MIATALLFLPCMTCLFWFALNLMVHYKDNEFKALNLFLSVTGIALFAEAGLTCTYGNAMLSLLLVQHFFALLIIPAASVYIRSLSSAGSSSLSFHAVIAVSVSLLAAQIILLMLTGNEGFISCIQNPTTAYQGDKAAKIIHLCSFWIFYSILAIETIAFITFSLIKYTKGNHHFQIINATAAILIFAVLELSVIFKFPLWIQAMVSVILACLLYYLSYSGILKGEKNPRPCVIAEQTSENTLEKTTDVSPSQVDARQSLAEEDSLRIRFEDLIVSEQLFLKQGIRLSDIATMLDTNRTYISRLVNNTYNMSFSDYINTLRIDYAEQYLLHNRDAKQSDIAAACGFPNASAFNNVFKKITGVTPKIWLATKS